MSERIGVLHLAPWVDLGGADKGIIDWFRHLDRERFAPSLICTQPSPNRWLERVEPYAEEVWVLPDVMTGSEFAEWVLGFIHTREIAVVHNMNSRLGFDLLPDIAALPDPPITVVQLHAAEPDGGGYVPYVAERYAQLVDCFSVTSRHLAQTLRSYDVPDSRLAVVYTGVDAEHEFDPGRVAPQEGLGDARHHVLWPGRLVAQKDPLLAVDAAAALDRRGVDFLLHMVGEGELAGEARGRAERLGVAHRIAWHPPSKEIARWYAACDLVLMTSTFEGIPYVVFEALAMGCPVVAPALPGNVELMDADAGALVAVAAGGEAYAEAMEGLLGADPAERAAAAARTRERMRRDFPLEGLAAGHAALYERLLARRGGRRVAAPLPPAPEPLALPRPQSPPREVAVVIACFRHGHYLPAALDSVRAQTLPAAEVVVVDDASDDPETLAVLDAVEAEGWARVVRLERNLGLGPVRNRAIAATRAPYVLPLDADDELLPNALEDMVAQLEQAPADVGFVYPNQRYMGTRSDYVTVPSYNLALLRNWNYCAACSLFDRRVFDAGEAYSDERAGYEDWDLVLSLAERGVHGVPAHGETFRYRKRGFSLVSARRLEGESPEAAARRRHPRLYDPRAKVKAAWAPALSVVLLGEGFEDGLLADQTCADVEVVCADPTLAAVEAVRVVDAHPDRATWLAEAIAAAAGRWVLVADAGAQGLLRRPQFAEHVLLAFMHGWDHCAVALVDAPGAPVALHQFAPDDGTLVGVGWERAPELPAPDAELGVTGSLLEDLLLALQGTRLTQCRAVAAR